MNLNSSLLTTDFHCFNVQLRWSKHHLHVRALFLFVICGYVPLLFRNIWLVASVCNISMETDTPIVAWTPVWWKQSVVPWYFGIWRSRILRSLLVRIFGRPERSPLSQCPSTLHRRMTNATVDLGPFNMTTIALMESPLRWQHTIMPLWKSDSFAHYTISFSNGSLIQWVKLHIKLIKIMSAQLLFDNYWEKMFV